MITLSIIDLIMYTICGVPIVYTGVVLFNTLKKEGK